MPDEEVRPEGLRRPAQLKRRPRREPADGRAPRARGRARGRRADRAAREVAVDGLRGAAARIRRAARRPDRRVGAGRSPASWGWNSCPARCWSCWRARRSSPTPRCTSTPRGRCRAVYRKLHMFDVEVGGKRLPRVRARAPRRGDRAVPHLRRRGPGADGLLRPALPRAVPDPRRAGGAADHRPGRLHAAHHPRPLGGAAAGPGDREPAVRDRRQPVRAPPRRAALRRALDDRRPVGDRAGAGSRTARATCWPRPTSARVGRSAPACPRWPTVARESYRWPQEQAV